MSLEVDVNWIAEQMTAEADVLWRDGAPSCFWCNAPGPGLYWLPSEEGVIEMAVWNCLPCVTQTARLRPPDAANDAGNRAGGS